MNLYDLDIVEEEAYLKWKDDVCDDYPGKGKSLFQVCLYDYGLLMDILQHGTYCIGK